MREADSSTFSQWIKLSPKFVIATAISVALSVGAIDCLLASKSHNRPKKARNPPQGADVSQRGEKSWVVLQSDEQNEGLHRNLGIDGTGISRRGLAALLPVS